MTLVLVGLAWIAGLVAVGAFGAPWWMGGAWTAAAAPILLFSSPLRRRFTFVSVCIAAALVAGFRLSQADSPTSPSWVSAIGGDVVLRGTIDSEPDRGETTTGFVVRVTLIEADGRPGLTGGKIVAYLHQYAEYLPGDRVTLAGTLDLPPEFDGFDYRAYLARRGISATMYRPRVVESSTGGASAHRWLTQQRMRFDRSLHRSLPEPEASLAAGIAFGRDDGLSREAKQQYNRSGLRHLVAVSGSNVSLVAALTYAVAVPFVGRRRAWLPAAITLLCYLAAAGLTPSVLRSGIMAGVLLTGTVIGRPQAGLPALFAAAIAMTAVSPGLTLDPGFQLSATATAGLITLSPWLAYWLLAGTARRRWLPVPRWACESIALTVAGSIATLPVMWVTFGEVSLVSPIANTVVQPVFAVAFWASIATAALGLVSRDLGEAAGAAAYYPLAFVRACALGFSAPAWASLKPPRSGVEAAVAAYTVLAGAGLVAYRFTPRREQEGPRIERRRKITSRLLLTAAGGATALAIIPITLAPRHGPGELVVAFLDVGQGDAALITTPHGQQVLIDGGPSGIELARELGAAMPHWDRSLDLVVLSHPQEDHIAGLPEVVRRMPVSKFSDTGIANTTIPYRIYAAGNPSRTTLVRGDSFMVDGVDFEVLWPPANGSFENLNDLSLVLRITYEETSFLFTADAEGPALEALAELGPLNADVLKVPHHGSQTTPAWFFGEVHPAVAIISAGAENVYGHPHESTLDALDGVATYRTDVSGRITIRSDGSKLRISTER